MVPSRPKSLDVALMLRWIPRVAPMGKTEVKTCVLVVSVSCCQWSVMLFDTQARTIVSIPYSPDVDHQDSNQPDG